MRTHWTTIEGCKCTCLLDANHLSFADAGFRNLFHVVVFLCENEETVCSFKNRALILRVEFVDATKQSQGSNLLIVHGTCLDMVG